MSNIITMEQARAEQNVLTGEVVGEPVQVNSKLLGGIVTPEIAFNKSLLPEKTNRYCPLPNETQVQIAEDCFIRAGYSLSNWQLGTNKKQTQFFAIADVEGITFLGNEIRLSVGLCNSYDKTLSARMCLGSKVLVCSNLCFHAYSDEVTGINTVIKRKHHNGVIGEFSDIVESAIECSIEPFIEKQNEFFTLLKNQPVKTNNAYGFIIEAVRNNVIGGQKLLPLCDYWDYQLREPESEQENNEKEWHKEFSDGSAWALFNIFTQIIKPRQKSNVVNQNLETLKFQEFFENNISILN